MNTPLRGIWLEMGAFETKKVGKRIDWKFFGLGMVVTLGIVGVRLIWTPPCTLRSIFAVALMLSVHAVIAAWKTKYTGYKMSIDHQSKIPVSWESASANILTAYLVPLMVGVLFALIKR
jgi:hypothetical protein